MVAICVPHDPRWIDQYLAEAKSIERALPHLLLSLHHIGSTAVPGLIAKPIIDLMGVAKDFADIDHARAVFEELGYQVMGAFGIEDRRYFRKLNSAGVRTHHLHIFSERSPHIERHLAFRDYLIAHPDTAVEYAAIKEELVREVGSSWDAYLDGKESFIRSAEKSALAWYRTERAAHLRHVQIGLGDP